MSGLLVLKNGIRRDLTSSALLKTLKSFPRREGNSDPKNQDQGFVLGITENPDTVPIIIVE